jgi:hypothetical protein
MVLEPVKNFPHLQRRQKYHYCTQMNLEFLSHVYYRSYTLTLYRVEFFQFSQLEDHIMLAVHFFLLNIFRAYTCTLFSNDNDDDDDDMSN